MAKHFIKKLYNVVNYIAQTAKDPALQIRKRKSAEGGDFSGDEAFGNPESPEPSTKKTELDQYGCRRWLPEDLPAGQTLESIEEARQWLCQQYSCTSPSDRTNLKLVENKMKATDWGQRQTLVKREGNLDTVWESWPYLQREEYFLSHATTLIKENPQAEDVLSTWNESLSAKLRVLWRIMGNFCNDKNLKKSSKHQKTKLHKLKMEMDEARKACKSQDSDLPRSLATFRLVATYLKEDFEDIVSLHQVRLSFSKLLIELSVSKQCF